MGLCSGGAQVFDAICKFAIESSMPDEEKKKLIGLTLDVLEDIDWDCQSDSAYFDHPLVNAVFRKMHPDWDWDE